MGVGNTLNSPGGPLLSGLRGARTSTVAVGKPCSAQLDQDLLASNKIYIKKGNRIIPLIKAAQRSGTCNELAVRSDLAI